MIAMIAGGVILTLMGGFISFAAVVLVNEQRIDTWTFALTPGVIFLIFARHEDAPWKRAVYSKPIPIFYCRLMSFTPTYNIRTIILSYPTGCLPTRKCHFRCAGERKPYGIYQHTASMNFISLH